MTISNSITNTIPNALAVAVAARVPVLLWGAPGTGKTSAINALAVASGLRCETVIASVREPSDFGGLPVVQADGSVSFAPPSWARRLTEAGSGLLFLDELSTAAPAVQAALLRVVLDRTVGDLTLPSGVAIVAAANPPEIAAGGWDLSAPLANRFVHLEWHTDGLAVAHGLVHGFRAPKVPTLDVDAPRLSAAHGKWAALIGGFLNARPSMHLVVPDHRSDNVRAWPSPRSWQMAITVAAMCEATAGGRDVELALLSGCVGEATTYELVTWIDALDLPDPAALLERPTSHPLPTRPDQMYVVLASVLDHIRANCTAERVTAGWELLGRAADTAAADVAASSALELAALQPPGFRPHPAVRKFTPVLKAAGLW